MKIFFITSKLNFATAGGSIEEFDLMIRTLQDLGNEVTVVTVFSYMNNIADPLPYHLIEEQVIARGVFGIALAVFKILRKYQSQTDYFHIDGHIFLYGAGLYRRLGGKRPIEAFFNRELTCWPQNVSPFFGSMDHIPISLFQRIKKSIRRLIEKYIGMSLANRIDIFSFTNPILKDEYEDFGLRRDSRTMIIGDPIDFEKSMKENMITPDSYIQRNKKKTPIILFYSSRMAPGKGFDLLLRAFAEIKHKENFKLILGGSGPEENLVKKMIQDFCLVPYVELLGWVSREKLFQFYKEADIFIQARWRHDLTSISLIYAMIFGLPSIVPGGGGLEWDARHSALYFVDNDYKDLARKIELLGNDADLRATLSQNAYTRLFEDEMNPQKQIARVHYAMRDIIKE